MNPRLGTWLGALATLAILAVPPPLIATPGESAPGTEDPDRLILVTIEQTPVRRMSRAGSTPRSYGGPQGYRVSPRAARIAGKLARAYELEPVDDWPIEALDVHCVVYRVKPERAPEEVMEALRRDKRVESVQPMQLFRSMADPPDAAGLARGSDYDDPYLPLQAGLHEIQGQAAHRWATGRGVRVALVDSGVDVGHPELSGQVTLARDFVEDRDAMFFRDTHGTAVAGVIGSAAGNGLGIVGVAPAARILALRACWQPEASQGAVCSTFTLAKAVSFAIAHGAQVLNLSLAGPQDPLLARLLSRAVEDGMVVVAAADPGRGAGPGFPASLPGVLSVNAMRSAAQSPRPDLSLLGAPGEDILTTAPEGGFEFVSGSSMAAAHVSGVAALLLERDRRLTPDRIVEILRNAAGPSPGPSPVNACRALVELVGGDCSERVPTTGHGQTPPTQATPDLQAGV